MIAVTNKVNSWIPRLDQRSRRHSSPFIMHHYRCLMLAALWVTTVASLDEKMGPLYRCLQQKEEAITDRGACLTGKERCEANLKSLVARSNFLAEEAEQARRRDASQITLKKCQALLHRETLGPLLRDAVLEVCPTCPTPIRGREVQEMMADEAGEGDHEHERGATLEQVLKICSATLTNCTRGKPETCPNHACDLAPVLGGQRRLSEAISRLNSMINCTRGTPETRPNEACGLAPVLGGQRRLLEAISRLDSALAGNLMQLTQIKEAIEEVIGSHKTEGKIDLQGSWSSISLLTAEIMADCKGLLEDRKRMFDEKDILAFTIGVVGSLLIVGLPALCWCCYRKDSEAKSG